MSVMLHVSLSNHPAIHRVAKDSKGVSGYDWDPGVLGLVDDVYLPSDFWRWATSRDQNGPLKGLKRRKIPNFRKFHDPYWDFFVDWEEGQ